MTNKRTVGRRSVEHAVRTRERILRRGERLFAKTGYRGVSLREVARACGVRMFTIQHHFGSKLGLYEECLRRGARGVETLLEKILTEETEPTRFVERIVDELFDFFLEHRDWVAINARTALGEGLPARGMLYEQNWVSFMNSTMSARKIGAPGLDVRLLLITVEGILNNHALSVGHYVRLFERDVTDPKLTARTKAHLKRVILAILETGGAP